MQTHIVRANKSSQIDAIRFVVGVDGGGSGTRLRLCERSGRLLAHVEAGPAALGQGVEAAWQQILLAVDLARAASGLSNLAPADCAIGLGLSGVGVLADVRNFLARQPGFALLALDSDGHTGVLGAHGGSPGAVLIAGTGTVGEALFSDGRRAAVSGWGWRCGDEGSGAWLGLAAMRLAQRALDGRAPVGELARAVWQTAGSDRAALLAWCANAGQAGFASLAPLVFEAAPVDDVAETLVDGAVRALEEVVAALDPDHQLALSLQGSVALRLQPRFGANLRDRLVQPQGDAAAGAVGLVAAMLKAGGSG